MDTASWSTVQLVRRGLVSAILQKGDRGSLLSRNGRNGEREGEEEIGQRDGEVRKEGKKA